MMCRLTHRSTHVASRESPETPSRMAVPTSVTSFHGMGAPARAGQWPPKIRMRQLRAGEDRRDGRRGRAWLDAHTELDAVQLDVVDGRDGHAVAVEHLPVEQVEVRVEHAPVGRGSSASWSFVVHAPAPVTMSSGIAAIAATRMMTR